ncbi:hypothetical protein [endosymbiont GvMRE of Glomus versiforme]|uniref:hypothetical protein n=1 Tax=endosymbiont GvMRE of Glomus versiforme TaxID=2039283 RepID=UPI001558F952|nr:hypothetical protein [endosymbiont GvMRE of Glomus versiforme]
MSFKKEENDNNPREKQTFTSNKEFPWKIVIPLFCLGLLAIVLNSSIMKKKKNEK